VAERTFHDFLYGDPKRVAAARVQARGLIAERKLKAMLFETVEWVATTWKGRFAFVGFIAVAEGIAFVLVATGVVPA
jgi:hypothetical protein